MNKENSKDHQNSRVRDFPLMEISHICNSNFHKTNQPENIKKPTVADALGVNKINHTCCLGTACPVVFFFTAYISY